MPSQSVITDIDMNQANKWRQHGSFIDSHFKACSSLLGCRLEMVSLKHAKKCIVVEYQDPPGPPKIPFSRQYLSNCRCLLLVA